jgi:hypothetical protein
MSLLSYYTTPEETVTRLRLLAAEAKRAAASLPKAHEHTLILAAMVSHYLTTPHAATPTAQRSAQAITQTLGHITTPTMYMLTAHHNASEITAHKRTRPALPAP